MPFKKNDPNINRKGRPKGSLSITSLIKKKLEEIPEGGKRSYAETLILRILNKAIKDGDVQMLKLIWNYVDGFPKQGLDVTTKGKPISTISAFKFVNPDDDDKDKKD